MEKKSFVSYLHAQNPSIISWLNTQSIENAVGITLSYFADFIQERKYSNESFTQGEILSSSRLNITDIITTEEFKKLVLENAKRLKKQGIETFTAVVNAIFFSAKDIHSNAVAIKSNKSRNAKAHVLVAVSQLDEVSDKRLTGKTLAYLSEKALHLAVRKRMRIKKLSDLVKLKQFCDIEDVEFYNSSPLTSENIENQQPQPQQQPQQLTLF